jgi:hypothetical protein
MNHLLDVAGAIYHHQTCVLSAAWGLICLRPSVFYADRNKWTAINSIKLRIKKIEIRKKYR